jgi:Ternary complex associated domain 9
MPFNLSDIFDSPEAYELAMRRWSPSEIATRLPEIISEADHSSLDDEARERRIRLAWSRADLSRIDFASIISAARAAQASTVRNAVASLLPPELRRSVYMRDRPAVMDRGAVTALRPIGVPNGVDPTHTPQRTAFADVVALTTDDDQATRRLVVDAGFSYHRVATLDSAQEMLSVNRDICALLIDASILAGASPQEQETLLANLALYSTFCVIKVDTSKLALSNLEVVALIKRAQCSIHEPDVLRLILRNGPGLQERDLAQIIAASARLSVGIDGGLYRPGEVSDGQLHLLAAALDAYASIREFSGSFQLESIRTTFLPGGVSEAKVAVARINDSRVPIVVKVNKATAITDEARRFFRYILPTNRDLAPEVYFHGGEGVILFGIIAESEVSQTTTPAPTLRDALRDARFEELRGNDVAGLYQNLVSAFGQACERLVALNDLGVPGSLDISLANPYLRTIKAREAVGFDWGFSDADREARDVAEAIFDHERESAISHGDSHSRNILVRRDQGYLIDYALSGPGHPAADLARLELSIFFTAMHPFGRSDDWVELQRTLSHTTANAEALMATYPRLFCSHFNRAAIRMCVAARDACLGVLSRRGLDASHYRAAKLLFAWQSLISPEFQQSFVRAAIVALSS